MSFQSQGGQGDYFLQNRRMKTSKARRYCLLYCCIEARVHSSLLNDHMITACLRFFLAETQNRRILQDLQQKRQMLLNQGQGGVGNVG